MFLVGRGGREGRALDESRWDIIVIIIIIIATKLHGESDSFVSNMQMTTGVKEGALRVEAADRFPPNLALEMKVEVEGTQGKRWRVVR